MFTGTKKEILDLIKRKGTLSADEAVKQTDLAKTTLREHFIQLERDGYIDREYIRSGPGRPSLRYRLTNKGNSLYPSYESVLIKELLIYLKNRGEEETIEDFFEEFWENRLQKARKRMNGTSQHDLKQKLQELSRMLQEEGFMPEMEHDDKGKKLTLKECNCPFSEVVKETRLPCKLEAMFYKKLFGDGVERTTHIAEGDFSCSYDIALTDDL